MIIIKHAGLASLILVNAPSPCRFNLTTVTKNRFPSQPAARKRRMLFDDPAEAGELLARALTKWRGSSRLVLAIPRGTVPMVKIVAERLDVDDGLATGATMVTTLHPMRAKNAKRQIGVNVPMAPAMRSSRTSG